MDEYYKKIIKVLSSKSGVDVDEITEDSYLDDDLNIGDLEKIEILTDLEEMFEIEGLVEAKDEIETVSDIIEYITDNIE